MNKTPIQWCDFTVNPFRFRNLETGKVGHHCDKISPGCKNCYSGTMQTGPYLSGLDFIAENKPKGEFFLDEGVLQQVLRRKKSCRIFWCDMTDMFLADYPDEWIGRCVDFMAETPHIIHQVLTKRSERMLSFLSDPKRAGRRVWPLPNVWCGVSVEDQQRADERIPLLLQTPAAVRFLSCEPLLGPINLEACGVCRDYRDGTQAALAKIDWVIVGGESGPRARPCDVAWIRSIVAQCRAASVRVFVKQLGSFWARKANKDPGAWEQIDSKGGNPLDWPHDLRVREFPEPRI